MNLYQPVLSETRSQQPATRPNDSLETLLHLKTSIFKGKLDVLVAAMGVRLRLMAHHLASIDDDKARITATLERITDAANYHFREHQEKGMLYRMLFTLEAEKRTQSAECWRDIVLVIRDFLTALEAHHQAQARATFVHDVGTGTEGYL
jgi:hypothetical protein